ncbi:MAG TPA: hypothetical protein ENK18_26560 [Deltaproteobacteria bacterium]|nr:hypothetical protein [Deltaproteobacteria bacterium]
MTDPTQLPWSLRLSWLGFGLGGLGPLGALVLILVIPDPEVTLRGLRFLSFVGQFLLFLVGALWGGLWGMGGLALALLGALGGAPPRQVRWAVATNLSLIGLGLLTVAFAVASLG